MVSRLEALAGRNDLSPLASFLVRPDYDRVMWFEVFPRVFSQFMHSGEITGWDFEDFRDVSKSVQVAVNRKE